MKVQPLIIGISCLLLLVCCDAVSALAATRTLVDQLGRTVVLPQKIQRIIPLGGAARYVVYLQAFNLVVGVEALENKKPATAGRPYNLAIRKRAEQLPVVAEGLQKPVNPEAIIALRPDLIITAEADRAQADFLSRITGTPVLVLHYGGMGVLKLDKAIESLRLLGVALGREKRAAQLVDYLSRQQREFDRRIGGGVSPSVYIGAVSHRGTHGITSTDGTYFPLQTTHTVNLAERFAKQGHLYIDQEQLLVWNPAVILIDASGLALVREDYIRHRNFYDRLAAFRNNQVYLTLPYNNYHTNLEIALANSWYIATVLHPEKFTDINPARKTDEICQVFVGIPCYELLRREYGGFSRLQFAYKTPNVN